MSIRPKSRIAITILAVFLAITSVSICGCSSDVTSTSDSGDESIRFTVSLYTNSGDQKATMTGNKVSLRGNWVDGDKFTAADYDYGMRRSYSSHTDGESKKLSSVISVTVDDKHMDTCGDTLLVTEDGLHPAVDFTTEYDRGKTLNDCKERFELSKIVLISAQDGTPIVAYDGNEVKENIADELPNTTILTIDGKQLFVHRANFQVMDAELLQ